MVAAHALSLDAALLTVNPRQFEAVDGLNIIDTR